MQTLLVSCPKCGSKDFTVMEPAAITYKCYIKVPFVCNKCGYRGDIKVLKDEKKEIEIVVE
jgi:C4-type Zn-finger protein